MSESGRLAYFIYRLIKSLDYALNTDEEILIYQKKSLKL